MLTCKRHAENGKLHHAHIRTYIHDKQVQVQVGITFPAPPSLLGITTAPLTLRPPPNTPNTPTHPSPHTQTQHPIPYRHPPPSTHPHRSPPPPQGPHQGCRNMIVLWTLDPLPPHQGCRNMMMSWTILRMPDMTNLRPCVRQMAVDTVPCPGRPGGGGQGVGS